jgi:hypothetical protein
VREGTGERAVVDGGGAHVVYCVKENGRGGAGGHEPGRFACESPAGLAGLPSKAHYRIANAHMCSLDLFRKRTWQVAGGPAPTYIPSCMA